MRCQNCQLVPRRLSQTTVRWDERSCVTPTQCILCFVLWLIFVVQKCLLAYLITCLELGDCCKVVYSYYNFFGLISLMQHCSLPPKLAHLQFIAGLSVCPTHRLSCIQTSVTVGGICGICLQLCIVCRYFACIEYGLVCVLLLDVVKHLDIATKLAAFADVVGRVLPLSNISIA